MLELAILGFLHESPMHGYELKQRLTMLTGHFRPVSDGALYPAISRLEKNKFLVKKREPGENGQEKMVLYLTEEGVAKLMKELADPEEMDISDRNRFFTLLAFLKFLEPQAQINVLQRRLNFLMGGKSFFSNNGTLIKYTEDHDLFRHGMLHIARETSRVERQWLKDTIIKLEEMNK
ncbi:PadR family transcriptional regulator [Paenibacillus sediminis]|uniref:DNA-binding PadR family transcriptional regulator n=1 Tax=Paenibacillus sediminis TaxID=664909 RepID=A0ABS4H0K8_9BACL|nr:PadR family transcriptional regulator [Paenibacillus sediminis]MBP1936060.1 DNA-binding PadR family transcriptional regulator [Paenibacillus sediminis]